MAINWDELEKKAARKDAAALKKNPKGYVGDVSASVQSEKAKEKNRKELSKAAESVRSSTKRKHTDRVTQRAAHDIKKGTVKKTDSGFSSTKRTSGYSKPLPKSAAKVLPKSNDVQTRQKLNAKKRPTKSLTLEDVKKLFLGSSYVDSNGKTARDNYDANPYTQEKQDKFWQGLSTEKGLSGTFGRAYTGVGKGFVDATTSIPSFIASKATGKDIDLKKSMGLELPKSADALQNTIAFKVGEVGGNLLGYGAQNIAAAPAIDAILAKTKLGQMAANAGTKLANTGVGRLAGEEAAKRFTTGLARNAVEAGTVGLAQNVGMASQEGLTGTDAVKDVLLNTGIDLVGGSVLEALPFSWAQVKGAKRTASDWLNERNAKKALETATPQFDEVIDSAKKVDVNQSVKATEVDNATTTLPKKSNKNLLKTESPELKLEKSKSDAEIMKADMLPKSHNGKELKPGGADVLKADMSVEEIAQRYGTFKGSKVPKATDMGDVSQSANTLYYAEMMDDKAREALLDGVKAGDYWKTTVKNKTVIDEAKEAIGSDLEGTLDSFLSVSKAGKQATSRDIAKGYALAEEYINKGDYATVENILADVGMMESEAGRTLQAMRIFNSQTPAGRVKSALKSVQKIESDHGIKIKVNQKLLDDVMNATSDAEKLAANKAFAVDVWNQVPATLGEKLNAWRYLSMLGNPKTHIRNILGNAIFYPFRAFSDGIATGLEKALGKKISKLGGNKSKAWVGFAGNDGELRKLAKSEYKSHRTAMEAASSKYIESLRPQEAKLYKAKPLEGIRKANSAALEKEDQIFMGMSFESAFSQYCKANGKKASEVTGKFRDEAIAYAQRRALEATYRDPNALASAINKLKRKTTISKLDSTPIKFGKKAAEITMESVLPFTKTPANILKRGVEYSPAGILGGAAKIATAKDAETLMKGIEYFASGLTGTGVMIAGYWLGKSGIVNGGMGEYDKVKAYNQMLGDQDYSINIGDKTFTIDWMAPMSMPFFVGVEVAGAEGEDRDMWETIEAMSTITDPLFEMSMLSGIDNVFDTAFSEGSPIVNVGKNAIQNYVSQYVPTMAGQIARTITKDRKTTLSTANSDLEKWANKGLDKLTNKVPGLTELNQPYIDQWGRMDSKQNASDYAWSAVENMLSPGYISERNETPVDKELKRLTTQLDEEDAKGIIPAVSSSAYKVKFEGKEYSMTESEFTKYKETVGQYRYNALHELFSTKEYKQASAADKRKMIMNVYEEGTELGKEKYLVGTGKTTKEKYDYSTLSDSQKEKVDESGISATKMRLAVKAIRKSDAGNGKAIEKAYALDGFSDDVKSAYGLSDRSINSAKEMKRLDIEYNDFEETANKIDANQNGGYTVDELTSYLNSTNKYTRQQKAAIFDALKSNPKTKNPYR